MTEEPQSERPSAPAAWGKRVRTRLTNAGNASRRTLGRLRGGTSSAKVEKPVVEGALAAGEVQDVSTELPDGSASAVRSTVNRARLLLLIAVAVAQVVLALVSWRIKARRARRRGESVEPDI